MLPLFVVLLCAHNSALAAVSYAGSDGADVEAAIVQRFGENEKKTLFPTAQAALNELLSSKADYAVVPVENTLFGLSANVPLVAEEYKFVVVGELLVPVQGNNPNNVTKFWVVAAHNRLLERGNKATLLVTGETRTLYRLLTNLNSEGLNVAAIHAYPAGGKLGQYKFLIDVLAKDLTSTKELTPAIISVGKTQKAFQIRIIGIYSQAQ
jgi:prephenate dehydratase